ncbi:MAG: hypothetical protein KKB81_04710 [Candidatus Margulisbacteria bacterium]|nr:hypothetical protein [Candidatus Margulisiibacteriota bacterium]MBU1022072.1 hypothetical protein [Candidatus Margulisiibacteriota bacterium]MBU1729667.1 hypothetical protein [Candidatus Margulisiibacteriota bacterium]MBU1954987.1 hypothetical protein [Candidatus Margulisiibacteriota bacterium]
MHHCSIEKETPMTVDLFNLFEVHHIDDIGQQIAKKEHLKYAGFHADATGEYTEHNAKVILHFNRVAGNLN